LLETVGLQREA